MSDAVSISRPADGVAVVTVDFPPVNAMGQEVLAGLEKVFSQLRDDSATRAIVLTGAGDKAFMAGGDISSFERLLAEDGAMDRFSAWTRGIFEIIEVIPQPLIGAVQAPAVGGGLEIALLCDLLVMDANAKAGLTEVGIGLIPGGGGTQRLTRRVGLSIATELMLTGKVIRAPQALEIGLVNKVSEAGKALADAVELATSIAAKPAVAVQAAKRAVREPGRADLEAGLELERALFLKAFASADCKEGFQAFLEKRAPQWTHS
ncbi:hypothetical protein HFP15_34825 [Amycolatopsis sp. K13G38]|uniref:Enoyl-CoA hydratase n=1 Tax=Amycolatopsis acididurans TaxID=2724524 RepID=A0ABX1JE30_9PSEU|nr:enoyl-CoA hydratase-related protein [Amycolatopsis acididurans]NKQ58047.1 hypothetical protein [Amycolatopsis acididurans]